MGLQSAAHQVWASEVHTSAELKRQGNEEAL